MTTILQDKKAIMHVLAGLMADPSILDNTREYKLSVEDFPETFHKIIFGSIYNLKTQGIERISRVEIDGMLSEFPNQYRVYNENGGIDYLEAMENLGHPENFSLHYTTIKKYSFLRSCIMKGIDISEIYDVNLVDIKESEKQQHKFNMTSLEDMLKYVEGKVIDLKENFVFDSESVSGHMADNLREIVAEKLQKPTYGANLASAYFTSATRGARLKKVYLVSGASGTGKSRFALSNMLKICVPEVWDKVNQEWIKTGATGRCLYVGTELDEEEVKIPAICYIANVDEDKIQNATLTEEEKERILKAIDILEETPFWFEELRDFDLADIEHVITKNINKHGVQYIAYDYLHTSVKMFTSMAKAGAGTLQEHQILLQMSNRIKEMANKHNVFIITSTQLNGKQKEEGNMDDSALSGAKAIAQKVDIGALLLNLTKNDEEVIASIMGGTDGELGRFGVTPNMSLNLYKNRGNRWKLIRIWLSFNHGTLHCDDVFVTDYKGNLIPTIKPLHVVFDEMEEVDVDKLPFNPDTVGEEDALPQSFDDPKPKFSF